MTAINPMSILLIVFATGLAGVFGAPFIGLAISSGLVFAYSMVFP